MPIFKVAARWALITIN
jgi:hypothetical protein